MIFINILICECFHWFCKKARFFAPDPWPVNKFRIILSHFSFQISKYNFWILKVPKNNTIKFLGIRRKFTKNQIKQRIIIFRAIPELKFSIYLFYRWRTSSSAGSSNKFRRLFLLLCLFEYTYVCMINSYLIFFVIFVIFNATLFKKYNT